MEFLSPPQISGENIWIASSDGDVNRVKGSGVFVFT